MRRAILVSRALESEPSPPDDEGSPPDLTDPPDGGGGTDAGTIPEPATGLLTALGVVGLALGRRKL